MKNMRRHFFIDKPLQTRYGFYIATTLFLVCGISVLSLYLGIWGSVIESFSDKQLFEEIKTAARIEDYEHSREPVVDEKLSSLRLFREIDLLSARQREIMKEILERTNSKLLPQAFVLILLIACGSIFLTHKIAGPFYRLKKSLESIQNGELATRIHLRKHDEGLQVADSFNQMAKTLDDTISRIRQIAHESNASEIKQKIESELSKFKTSR